MSPEYGAEEAEPLPAPIDEAVLGAPRPGSGRWASNIRLIDPLYVCDSRGGSDVLVEGVVMA